MFCFVVNSLYHISAGISSFFGSPHFNTYNLSREAAAGTGKSSTFPEDRRRRRRNQRGILKGAIFMKQIFVLTYNYTNKKLAQMAIACVIRCRSTHGKQLRVRDIIEMNRPGLYQQLSRGDKCRVGRAVSKLYNQGMLPHLTKGKKKGSTNTYFC